MTVRFKQAEPAEACVSLMDGRFFGGNKLAAHMWDGFTQYHGVSFGVGEEGRAQQCRGRHDLLKTGVMLCGVCERARNGRMQLCSQSAEGMGGGMLLTDGHMLCNSKLAAHL